MLISGCRVTAPVHRWQEPQLGSTVAQTVLLPEIVGPSETARSLQKRLIDATPRDDGRAFKLVSLDTLENETLAESAAQSETPSGENSIALVSHQEQIKSDVSLLPLAKSHDVQYLLRGEILTQRRAIPIDQVNERLTVSWCLTPIAGHEKENPGSPEKLNQNGTPVVVTFDAAIEKYPDLAWLNDRQAVLEIAMVRETMALIAPSIQRDRLRLDTPWISPGSLHTFLGNHYASTGRWPEAETQWQKALRWNPLSTAAMHNLAIAKAAKQDFSAARQLAKRAILFAPTKRHQRTAVWVETAQRSYHEAFALGTPAEGWSVTRSPADNVQN
ncbi:hypothetical protein LOC67_26055 [Stieleria sp. JC731]|uniref:tetratricopeptide repeat protein n=1 Tax=Pirellulaceae TaxID=2691357 RepID=UPI001E4BC158|nr:tetratricopeptide repeat protein [Stieleria sp. JC731]MCC9604032.1 hypothetical protein [Stieleria sp. JC731]